MPAYRQMNQRRVTKLRFARLPNVVPMASVETNDDLVTLVRRIVREEVHRLSESAIQPPLLESPSSDEMIREEVQNALCPVITSSAGGIERTPTQRRPSTYFAAVRRPRRPTEPSSLPRKTHIWRTDDNRPVRFHCGHVIRYCRERIANSDAHRNWQATNRQPQSQNFMDEFIRQDARELASSTSRGRSATDNHPHMAAAIPAVPPSSEMRKTKRCDLLWR
ncbi:hypothetical protein AVEN_155249-1 [Araneus ventricosus]|uniref:Uncharacterized protein n=1 Tax=Araneus ventricosus TaxID=182803 RepID=A0A4Y2D6D3_ARAVE|nr:hypothetical protein AVEN_155249-1 [Araneus ventricosus]